MKAKWFAGPFCPTDAHCSLGSGALSPSNGPKIQTLEDSQRPSQQYIGTITMFPDDGSFAASGENQRDWAKCDGQLFGIAEHTAMFTVLGTVYGGDGRLTFGIPDLRDTPGSFYICTNGYLSFSN